MRRSLVFFSFALVLGAALIPTPAFAQNANFPFFGPIIPNAVSQCPASWAMLIDIINRIIMFSITLAVTIVLPLMVAYAGFLYVVNPVNPGGRAKANSMLLNTVGGILIALGAWLIVNAVMAVLYKPDPSKGFASNWASIINSGGQPQCLELRGSLERLDQVGNPVIAGYTASGKALLSFGSGACDPNMIQQSAKAGGYTLTTAQANTFACIAGPESTCGSVLKNYAWNTGTPTKKGSSAAGPFQVLLSTHSQCYENVTCYQAAGVSGNLNCKAGFDSNGNPKTDPASVALVERCLKAAGNLNCSTSAAACVLNKDRGSFAAWTKDARSATQNQCIATYNI